MNLPTTQGEWEIANSFFHSELPISEVNKDNLNNVTEKFNRIVYVIDKLWPRGVYQAYPTAHLFRTKTLLPL